MVAACAPTTVQSGAEPAQESAPAEAQRSGAAQAPAGTADPAQVETAPELARVAVIVPLTGQAAELGQDLIDAAQLALFDIADDRFEMRIYDSGGNAFAARAAAQRALADGARLIIGPLLSDAVAGAAEVTRPAGVPMLSFSNNRLVMGSGVWTMGYLPEGQIRRAVDFARQRGMTRFAALAPQDEYGTRMADALRRAVDAGFGQMVDTRYYYRDTDSMTETIRSLARYDSRAAALRQEKARLAAQDDALSKRALARLENRDTLGEVGFDALFLPAGGSEVLQVAPLLAFFDIDADQVKLLGTWIWDDAALGVEPTMVGAWFAAPPPSARTPFVERFASTYGRQPARLATLGYDATALAAVLARRDGPSGDPFAAAKLTHPDGFTGADGLFRLTPDGLNERGLAMLEVQRDGAVVIDPAPVEFGMPVIN